MNVNGTELRHAQDVLGQNGIRHHHKQIGIILAEVFFKFGSLQIERLQHRQIVIEGGHLHRRRREHASPARGSVGLGNNSKDFLIGTRNEVFQKMRRKFRRSHKYNLHGEKDRKDKKQKTKAQRKVSAFSAYMLFF